MSPLLQNTKIQTAFVDELKDKLPNIEKKANKALESFQELVNEIIKVQNLSNGTPQKDQIKGIAGNLNNSTVAITNMIGADLITLRNMLNSGLTTSTENA